MEGFWKHLLYQVDQDNFTPAAWSIVAGMQRRRVNTLFDADQFFYADQKWFDADQQNFDADFKNCLILIKNSLMMIKNC